MDKTGGVKRSALYPGDNKDRDTNSCKQAGLSAELIAEIEKDPELESLIRLNEIIKKVRNKNDENRDKTGKLDVAFKSLLK